MAQLPELDGAGLLQRARAVADSVLYEGYLLYPYRASAAKNQMRWQFGVLGPQGAESAGVGEGAWMHTELLLAAPRTDSASVRRGELRGLGAEAAISVRVRFLQLQTRRVERAETGNGSPGRGPTAAQRFHPVSELTVDGQTWLSWDEAVEQEVDLGRWPVAELLAASEGIPVEAPGGEQAEALHDGSGQLVGRVVRVRRPLQASLRVERLSLEDCVDGSPDEQPWAETPAVALRLQLRNERRWTELGGDDPGGDDGFASGPAASRSRIERDASLRDSLIAVHLVLLAQDSEFVSMIDPPEWASSPAARCSQHRLWPVLVGRDGEHDAMLAAPIILYDWPEIAEESAGNLFDSTEVDELLSLRVMTMTDDEKREARATDAMAAEILDRCDELPPEMLERMHGATRSLSDVGEPPVFTTPSEQRAPWWDPGVDASVSPATDAVQVAGVAVAAGSTVRLRPKRRADAQDLFLADQLARVTGVHHDVDGGVHVAVVLHDDPAAELHEWYGRYFYFGPEEVEPLASADGEVGSEVVE